MKLLIALAWILAALVASAATNEIRLPIRKDIFTLRAFDAVHPHWHYFGEYVFPIEYTGGTKLHLFPNGRFAISRWVDIGGDEMQAAGTFKVKGDRLALQFTRIRPGEEELKKKFSDLHLVYGRIEKKEYVTGFEVFVLTGDEWQTLQKTAEKAKYMIRRTEYNDWERILRDYEAQIP